MIILTMANKNNFDTLYHIKITNLVIKYRNFILYYYNNNYYFKYKKFKDYYIKYHYYDNKLNIISYFNYSGELHREDGPTRILYNNDEIYKKEYYLNDEEYSYEDYLLEVEKLVCGVVL